MTLRRGEPYASGMRKLALVGAVVLCGGCVIGGSVEHFMKQGFPRAKYELQREQLTVTAIGNGTFGVDGCGKRAIYQFVSDSSGGVFVNNTGVEKGAAPPAPAAPAPPPAE